MSIRRSTVSRLALVLLFTGPLLGRDAAAYSHSEILERFCRGEDFFIVTTTADYEDADGCTDEDCTLREAVNAANLCPDDEPGEIRLSPATYTLETTGFAEPLVKTTALTAGGSGLDILGGVVIYGNGATIQRLENEKVAPFRLFEVRPEALLVMRDVTLRGGHAWQYGNRRNQPRNYGGAIYVMEFGRLSLYRTVVQGNRAYFDGGGIYNLGVSVISSSTISANQAERGGGMLNGDNARAHVIRSTLSNNEAIYRGLGGALFNHGALEVEASTISGNRAANDGGGIVQQAGQLSLKDTTVYGNEGLITNGGLSLFGSTSVTNTVVAGNMPADCGADLASATLSSSGRNLDSDGTCTGYTALNFRTDAPLLGPLRYNGGPTRTHKPLAGSPLVDTGEDCSSHDQRGERRPRDGDSNGTTLCDIGAVETISPFESGDLVIVKEVRRFRRSIWMSRFSHIPTPIFENDAPKP